MPIEYEIADKIFRATKTVAPPFEWETVSANNKNEQRRRFEGRIRLDGTIPRGVWLRIMVFPNSLVRSVFQLECDIPESRSHLPLYRLEVDPLTSHPNKLYGVDEINGLFIDVGVTHEHVFYDSLKDDGTFRNIRRCDEQARIVINPPSDFMDALQYVSTKINLTNSDQIPPLNAQGLLF